MKPSQILYSRQFVKKFKKLPPKIKKLAIKKEKIFKQNITQPSLKTHKLSGQLSSFFAFSVNHSYRILFAIEPDQTIVFINIGTHSIYK